MNSKVFACSLFLLPLAYYLAWVGMLSYLIHFTKHLGAADGAVDLSYLYQVSDDWNTKPFIDITVTNQNYCPSTHPHEVFYDIWPGGSIKCDCLEHKGNILDRACKRSGKS